MCKSVLANLASAVRSRYIEIEYRYNSGDKDGCQSRDWETQRVPTRHEHCRHGMNTVDDYVNRFELYTVANNITDDKKIAAFLTSMGATTYST